MAPRVGVRGAVAAPGAAENVVLGKEVAKPLAVGNGKRRALGEVTTNVRQAGGRSDAGKLAKAQPAAPQQQHHAPQQQQQAAAAAGAPAAAAAVAEAMAGVRLTRSQARALAGAGSAPSSAQARNDAAMAATVQAQLSLQHAHEQPAQHQQQQQQQQLHQAEAQNQQQQRQQNQQQRRRRTTTGAAPVPQPQQQPQQQARAKPAPPLPDIDGADRANPLSAAAYVEDVYRYYRRVEPEFRVPADYMAGQADVNERMRAILVDWLVEVHLKFKLNPETLFLAVALIDRYLAAAQVTRKNLQLVGVTAMLIAAKYEEIWAPEVRDFVYISDKAYDRAQILAMERAMLRALGYRLTQPTSYQYLARLLKAAGAHYDKPLALFVAYCAELALLDYGCLRFSSTDLAAGVMLTALSAFGRADDYPPALAAHAARTRAQALPAARAVARLVARAKTGALQAVVKKYSAPKFCEAALVAAPAALLGGDE